MVYSHFPTTNPNVQLYTFMLSLYDIEVQESSDNDALKFMFIWSRVAIQAIKWLLITFGGRIQTTKHPYLAFDIPDRCWCNLPINLPCPKSLAKFLRSSTSSYLCAPRLLNVSTFCYYSLFFLFCDSSFLFSIYKYIHTHFCFLVMWCTSSILSRWECISSLDAPAEPEICFALFLRNGRHREVC